MESVPVVAPMQATVVSLSAEPGTVVARGDEVAVLEAMKMEHVVTAPYAGTLTEWRVQPGDVVDAGAVLAVLTATGDVGREDRGEAPVDLDQVRPDLAETL